MEVDILIRDRGPGLAHDELGKVFEPFYRVESSRNRETGGTGLGLAIARQIARAHGGDVRLANRTQGGLEVCLRLPR
jgi:protein-histidine pros-kinase